MTAPAEPPRRSLVGAVSLAVAVVGAAGSRLALLYGPFADTTWLRVVAAGFEAGVVGALADWFAVTALFRRPFGLPIPHTDIIRTNKKKLIDGIVNTIEKDWLSPEVIGAQLQRFTPSAIVVEWLKDAEHVGRLGAPLRTALRAVVKLLDEDEVVRFVGHMLTRQLGSIPLDRSSGEWIRRAMESPGTTRAIEGLAVSLANLAAREDTAAKLHWWIDRSALTLRESGRRVVPFLLRRKSLQRLLVEAACEYASSELRSAARDPEHPLRRALGEAVKRYADRLSAGDAEALGQIEGLRSAVLESLEAGPLVQDALSRLRRQLELDLDDPASQLSRLIDEKLHAAIVEYLADPAHRDAFDRWVRTTADDLLRRHHHAIGRTVRENLESRDPGQLVRQIEDRVGADLQFIRLNGAVVGGLIGVLLALLHLLG